MSQFDYGTINPTTKSGTVLASDLNSFRDALNSNHSGTSRPSYVATGMIWADSTAANYIFKMYDGTDDIPVFVTDATNNVSRVALDNDRDSYIVSDVDDEIKIVIVTATVMTFVTGGLKFASGKSLIDSNGNNLVEFVHTASAVNDLEIANAATGNGPELRAKGTDSDIDVEIIPKGTGNVDIVTGNLDVLTGSVQEAGVSISPIGQQTVWVPAGAMVSRTTTGAAFGEIELATNDVMLSSFDFDTAADEHVQFAIQMPKGWDEGTIIAQFIWSHPTTATNFGVVFFIQAVAFANDDAGDTAFGTAVSATDTGGTADDIYISPETSAMTVAGTPGAEEYVIFQIYRDVSDASDTLAVDARLHGVKLHYTLDAATDD